MNRYQFAQILIAVVSIVVIAVVFRVRRERIEECRVRPCPPSMYAVMLADGTALPEECVCVVRPGTFKP